jgi:hypothetical protein
VVVSFATADLFQCLVTHSSVTNATWIKEIDDTEASPEYRAFWQKHDPAKPLVNVKPFDFDPTATVASAPIVILPRIFPLPCPCPFPLGIISSMKACANVNDLAKIISHYCDDTEESTSAWLGFCPLFYEWFHAACAHPDEFASTWMAKNWIQKSLSLTTPCRKWSPTFDAAPFRSQHVANLLKLLFLMVDWRVHLDILFATVCSNPVSTLSKRFACCLERGHLRAFSDPSSPLGQVPWRLAGEQLAVRPPSIQSYWSTLGLAYFVEPGDDLPVNVRDYFVIAVDCLLSSSYTITPLLTNSEAARVDAEEDPPAPSDLFAPTPQQQRVMDSARRLGPAGLVSLGRRLTVDLTNPDVPPRTPSRAVRVPPPVTRDDIKMPPPVPTDAAAAFDGRSFLPPSPTRTFQPAPWQQSGQTQLDFGLGLGQQAAPFQETTLPPYRAAPIPPFSDLPPEVPAHASTGPSFLNRSGPLRAAVHSVLSISAEGTPNSLQTFADPADPRNPPGLWFFCAWLGVFQADFDGCYAGSTRIVEPVNRLFAATLWDRAIFSFFAVKLSTDAAAWVQALAMERCRHGEAFRSDTTFSHGDIYVPHDPKFAAMPAAVIDAFRRGQWRLMAFVQTADELTTTFSAFSLLWWIRRTDSSSGKFPSDGVSYAEARGPGPTPTNQNRERAPTPRKTEAGRRQRAIRLQDCALINPQRLSCHHNSKM